MTKRNAKHYAEWIASSGRKCYEDDHAVRPVLFFIDNENRVVFMHPGPRVEDLHPTDAYAEIVYRIGKVHPWRYIGTCTEAWSQEKPASEEEMARERIDTPPNWERGTLQKLAEAGDTSVSTTVLVMVVDLKNRLGGCTIMSKVLKEEPVEWDILTTEGDAQGAMVDLIRDAYEQAPEPPEEMPRVPLAMIAEILDISQLAYGATAGMVGV